MLHLSISHASFFFTFAPPSAPAVDAVTSTTFTFAADTTLTRDPCTESEFGPGGEDRGHHAARDNAAYLGESGELGGFKWVTSLF